MDFYELVDHVATRLQQRGRMTYRSLRRQFALDDETLDDLKEELLSAYPEVVDDKGRGLVWTGDTASAKVIPEPTAAAPTPTAPEREPASYTPQYLAEKILTSRHILQGERKQVTVMFCDIKDATDRMRHSRCHPMYSSTIRSSCGVQPVCVSIGKVPMWPICGISYGRSLPDGNLLSESMGHLTKPIAPGMSILYCRITWYNRHL